MCLGQLMTRCARAWVLRASCYRAPHSRASRRRGGESARGKRGVVSQHGENELEGSELRLLLLLAHAVIARQHCLGHTIGALVLPPASNSVVGGSVPCKSHARSSHRCPCARCIPRTPRHTNEHDMGQLLRAPTSGALHTSSVPCIDILNSPLTELAEHPRVT